MKGIKNDIVMNLQDKFDILWRKFIDIFPIADNIVKKKDVSRFKQQYVRKYQNICDSGIEAITSNCLLDRFISSFAKDDLNKQFEDEINGIVSVSNKALNFSKENQSLYKGIKDIIRNMILTIDVNPSIHNNDYRNRLNELLVFNWLSECENITIKSIEKKLENRKSCDFECSHIDGSLIMFEVLSINNLDVNKQDSSQSFTDFIEQKVENKYSDKTEGLSVFPYIKIIPILEYTDGLENFNITLSCEYSTPPYTVIKNSTSTITEILLCELNKVSEHIQNQKHTDINNA